MAKEVGLFKGGVPAHLQGEVSETTKALMGGGGTAKRVSIRGGVFRMMVGSDEVAQNTDRSMKFVIVGSAPAYARTYYAGAYKEGDNKPPTCWSDDGKEPNKLVVNKQAKTCADCPMNIKGSGQDESRACRYSARIAVLLDGDMEGDVYAMSVPATSLFGEVKSEKYEAMQGYARKLAGYGFDIRHVVTEMRFDTDSDVPKLMFAADRPLEADEWEIVKDLEGTEELEELVGPREFSAEDQTTDTTDSGEEEEIDEDDDAPEPEPKPKRRTRTKKAEAKPKVEEVDEEIDEEIDEEDDDPEPEPVKRKKASKPEVNEDDEDLSALLDEWAGDDD